MPHSQTIIFLLEMLHIASYLNMNINTGMLHGMAPEQAQSRFYNMVLCALTVMFISRTFKVNQYVLKFTIR